MRIGLHINDNRANQVALDYCRRVQPAFMKWLAPDAHYLRLCREASPNTKHILRVVWEPQTHEARGAFNARALDKAREFRGLIDYHEGYNEHIGDKAPADIIRAFARDEVDFAKKLNAEGFGALIGGFSTGTLDDTDVEPFAAAFDYMQAVGPAKCALHFHEYAAAYVPYQVKTPDGRNQWPDGGSFTGISPDPNVWWDPKLRGWLTLRYRDLMDQIKGRWPNVRAVVTEWGIDNTNKDPRQNAKGWKGSRGTEFENIPGLGDYAGQSRWYAWQVSHDPDFIIGVVDFGNGDPEWESFRLDNEPAMLERFIAGQLTAHVPRGSVPPVSVPAPPAPPAIPPPASVLGVEPRILVLPGENSWLKVARRALGNPNIPVARGNELRDANPGGLKVGAWLRSPWHKVTRSE